MSALSAWQHRAHLDALRADPDADAPRRRYADWLDDRDPQRAEFVRLQLTLHRLSPADPRRPALARREDELLHARGAAWAGAAAGHAALYTFVRGVVEFAALDAGLFLKHGAKLLDEWPLVRVRFLDVAPVADAWARSPLLGRLREIDLAGTGLGNAGPNLLARCPHLERLEALDLSGSQLTDEGAIILGQIPALRRLRSLGLSVNDRLDTPGIRGLTRSPHLGRLRRLDLSENRLRAPVLRLLDNSPELRRLDDVGLHGNEWGDEGAAVLGRSELVGRMLARSPRLDLRRCQIGAAGAAALADSPRLAAAEALDLSENSIGDEGMVALARSDYLRPRELALRYCQIGAAGVRALLGAPLTATLERLDLSRNAVPYPVVRDLHDAHIAANWERRLEVILYPTESS